MADNPGEGSRRLPKSPDNRRFLDTTSITMSSRASSLEQAMRTTLALEDQLEKQLEGMPAEESLKRMLSIRSIVSTTSSFAQRQTAAVGTNIMFREIGTGSIGKVFEHPGTVFVYKLPVSGQPKKLWNNYVMHKRIESSFQTLPHFEGQVEIPRCFWYATHTTNAFWDKNLEFFPHTPEFPRAARHVLCMERIFPLPKPIRHALIAKYCPPQAQATMKESETNKHCLVRPCLGRIKYGGGNQFFSLRNFKLHANQMQDLSLSTAEFYVAMAQALAVLHWHTNIDAKDIEFVLGSSPLEEQLIRADVGLDKLMSLQPQTSTYEEATHTSGDFTKRVTSLWMLDFDDCEDITMDEAGVDKAVNAFIETNLYCPKSNTGNEYIESLWAGFRQNYVQHSDKILIDHVNKPNLCFLPRQFVDKLTQQTAPRQQPSQGSQNPRQRSRGRGASSFNRQSNRSVPL
ncbi:hypothetical protein TARUN_5205 [Trichoderma arundinaceum]|uniref:DUF3669 domain-containing protein n=1 Tax=Trichoderma arundinaceum TaxID=490622 RepID=A0A395NLU1_TRIAR|nr:hypothetical protein TARUN_5205 [Trichoderma arundinaceum]